MNRKESRSSTSKVWFSLVLVVFLSITGVDFVVNSILYSHGLDFSYSWYIPYLTGLSAIICSICFLVGWQSYIDTNSMNVALKRGSTLFFAHLGGLVDWMFFLIYNGGQVYAGEWTWMWQYSLIGTWNWKLQGIWSLSFLVLIFGIWKAKRIMLFNRVSEFLHITLARNRKK